MQFDLKVYNLDDLIVTNFNELRLMNSNNQGVYHFDDNIWST